MSDEASPQPAARRIAAHWRLRTVDAVSAYLPMLLMAVLALGTWWLVKNTPLFETARVAAPARHVPDYTMTKFMVQRFAPSGKLRAQIEGDVLRHFPDTDTFEIDNPRIRAIGDEDGRVTRASARRGVANHDASEVQLIGDAHVVREATPTDQAIDFRSEFLHYFQNSERVQSHLPVVVTQGSTEVHADGMSYDNLTGQLDFKGRTRAVMLPPRAAPTGPPKAAKP